MGMMKIIDYTRKNSNVTWHLCDDLGRSRCGARPYLIGTPTLLKGREDYLNCRRCIGLRAGDALRGR